MKVKVRLDTLADINGFVSAVNQLDIPDVYLTDGNDFTVSAKSILGAMCTIEWNEVYCTCSKDIYYHIQQYVEV